MACLPPVSRRRWVCSRPRRRCGRVDSAFPSRLPRQLAPLLTSVIQGFDPRLLIVSRSICGPILWPIPHRMRSICPRQDRYSRSVVSSSLVDRPYPRNIHPAHRREICRTRRLFMIECGVDADCPTWSRAAVPHRRRRLRQSEFPQPAHSVARHRDPKLPILGYYR